LHAVPNAPNVDVYANGIVVARNLGYRGFTEYMNVAPGAYNIEIFPTGRQDVPVLRTNATLAARTIYTLAAVGQLPNISLLPITEPKMVIPTGMTMVRASHLSPTAPHVNVTMANGTILFNDVEFMETTNYIPVRPGNIHLQLRALGTNQVVLDIPNINLQANRQYTVYVVGLPGGQPTLQVLIPLDGASYLST
jgi:hypothetical protein